MVRALHCLRLGALAGQLSVYLGAGLDQLDIQVPVGSDGAGRTEVKIEGESPSGKHLALDPRRCSAGCFTMRFPWETGVTRLGVPVSARFDVPWPLAPGEPRVPSPTYRSPNRRSAGLAESGPVIPSASVARS